MYTFVADSCEVSPGVKPLYGPHFITVRNALNRDLLYIKFYGVFVNYFITRNRYGYEVHFSAMLCHKNHN